LLKSDLIAQHVVSVKVYCVFLILNTIQIYVHIEIIIFSGILSTNRPTILFSRIPFCVQLT